MQMPECQHHVPADTECERCIDEAANAKWQASMSEYQQWTRAARRDQIRLAIAQEIKRQIDLLKQDENADNRLRGWSADSTLDVDAIVDAVASINQPREPAWNGHEYIGRGA